MLDEKENEKKDKEDNPFERNEAYIEHRKEFPYYPDKHIRVALAETTIIIDLHRTDLRRPYIGRLSGLEFEYDPKGKVND